MNESMPPTSLRLDKDPHVQRIFTMFCGAREYMDGKSFVKVLKDCKAIDKTFIANDADLIFARIVSKGQRKIGLEQFAVGLELVAHKKGIHLKDLYADLSGLMGPTMYATRAE